MALGTPIPILRIFSEDMARSFYCGFLDFVVDWEHRFADGMPVYMQVSRGGCILHLSEHHGDATPGTSVRIPADDIDALIAGLNAKAYKYARPGIEIMPWGRRESAITDPFGNRLTFYGPLLA